MKLFLTYLTLQLKRLCQFLPKLILGTIVLAILAGAIAFYGANVLYDETSADKISIAIVLDDESALMDLAMTYLQSSESVNSFCNLIPTSQKEAAHMLKTNQISASIHFPKNFSRDIITGKNTPATITFSKETGIEQLLFQELTAAASRILNYAQASIYSLSDLYDIYDFRKSRSTHFDYINRNTMQTALLRSSLFEKETISATGSTSAADYYTATGIILLLFLSAMSLGKFSLEESIPLGKMLSLKGLTIPKRNFARLITLLCFYTVIGGLLITGLKVTELGDWSMLCFLPLLALLLSCQTLCLYNLTTHQTTGILLIFFYTFISTLCSGCLIPTSFLPDSISGIAGLFPAYYAHGIIIAHYDGSVRLSYCIVLLLFSILFYILSCIFAWKTERSCH